MYKLIIIIFLFIYYYDIKLFKSLLNLFESFRNLNTKTQIVLPGKRINSIPSTDPDEFYKSMYANRDYVSGELIDEWIVNRIIDNKTKKTNATRKRVFGNKWNFYATKDIRRGKEIIIN